jgi:hypothetical protein
MDDIWEAQAEGGSITRGSLEQLRMAFAAGRLSDSTLVRRAGFEKWAPLGDVLAVADGRPLGGPTLATPTAGVNPYPPYDKHPAVAVVTGYGPRTGRRVQPVAGGAQRSGRSSSMRD